jgi:hypothetical protein
VRKHYEKYLCTALTLPTRRGMNVKVRQDLTVLISVIRTLLKVYKKWESGYSTEPGHIFEAVLMTELHEGMIPQPPNELG